MNHIIPEVNLFEDDLIEDNIPSSSRFEQPKKQMINKEKSMKLPSNDNSNAQAQPYNKQYESSISSLKQFSNNNFDSQPRYQSNVSTSQNFDHQPEITHQLPKGSQHFNNPSMGSFKEAKLNINYSSTP
jgi:hypothetical protein